MAPEMAVTATGRRQQSRNCSMMVGEHHETDRAGMVGGVSPNRIWVSGIRWRFRHCDGDEVDPTSINSSGSTADESSIGSIRGS